MKASTFLAMSLLAIGLTACSDGGSSSTAPSPYKDVKSADLTTSDKSFLAQLAASPEAFTAISKASEKSSSSAGEDVLGGARAMVADVPCVSPTITHEVEFELGDSVSIDSFPGSTRVIWDDTTTKVDLVTGADVTCDESGSMDGFREFSRQSSIVGTVLTSYMKSTSEFRITGDLTNITSLEDFAKLTMDLTGSLKGVVTYTNGFTLDIDTGSFHMAGPLLGLDLNGFDLYYHVNFRGYPYSSGMRYDRTSDALIGDVVRGSDRIGTMKVYNDDRMEVKDLDGNLIQP